MLQEIHIGDLRIRISLLLILEEKKNQSRRRKEGADTEMRTKYPTD